MEVKPGYKPTEVGVIPEDWDVSNFNGLFNITAGGDVDRKRTAPDEDETHCYPIYSNALTNRGLYGYCSYADHQSGSITITARGTLGSANFRNHCYTAIGRVLVLQPKSEMAGSFFAELINHRVRFAIESTSVPQLTAPQISAYQLLVPPLREQKAIAEALSDADALIESLERLIAKKRLIKQGAMQELLTGKKRLPGFSGEWEVKRLSELLKYERSDKYIVKCTDYHDNAKTPVLTANKSFFLGRTDEDFGIYDDLPAIIFDDFTTDCKYVDFPFKVKSSAIKILTTRNQETNLRWLFERMRIIDFPLGEHKRYYISEYQHLEIPTPKPDEQATIASVLTDFDSEIAALEARLAKARMIKHGMMNELLTGRIRLV